MIGTTDLTRTNAKFYVRMRTDQSLVIASSRKCIKDLRPLRIKKSTLGTEILAMAKTLEAEKFAGKLAKLTGTLNPKPNTACSANSLCVAYSPQWNVASLLDNHILIVKGTRVRRRQSGTAKSCSVDLRVFPGC